MTMNRLALLGFSLFLLLGCEQNKIEIRISADTVEEGEFTAKALSTTKLISNYPMHLDHSIPQPIIFKLSLNGQDNEAGYGVDHYFSVPEGVTEFYTPGLRFGEHIPPQPGKQPALNHAANVHFRVDMKPILEAFSIHDYYITPTNDTIYVDDFEGLYIAGAVDPMEWVWDKATIPEQYKFTDTDQDSIYELSLRFEPPESSTESRSWELSRDLSSLPHLSSPQAPLLEALTNLALEEAILNIRDDGAFSAGKEWQGVWTRDVSFASQLSLAYLFPENVKTSLRAKLNSAGRIIQDTGTGGSWPISSDRHVWTLAAWEVFLATGDQAWLDEISGPVIRALQEDILWNRDPISGMLLGETSFEDWREQTYAPWMSPADIHSSHALSTNLIFKRALEIGLALTTDNPNIIRSWPELIQRLDQNIVNHFWNPKLNAPASYVISAPAWIPASHRDLLGESLGILFSQSFSKIASDLVETYPRSNYGSSVISHQLPHAPPYHNKSIWPFVEAYGVLAAKQVGNQAAYSHGFNGLIRAASLFLTHRENYHYSTGRPDQTEINSDGQLWSTAGWLGAIYKGLFGITYDYDFDRKGFDLNLNPNNPFEWNEFLLTNMRAHNTPFSINLMGTGSTVLTINVNGQGHPVDKPIPLLGEPLDIVVVLAPVEDASSIVLGEHTLPAIPSTLWSADTLWWESGSPLTVLEINGRVIDTLDQSPLVLPDSISGFFTLRSVDSTGTFSLPSQPQYLGPSAALILNGAAPYYIELGRDIRFIEMSFNLPTAGSYLIRFVYSNSGPITTGNTCGLAKLSINDWWLEQMVSFPHTDSWDKWNATAWTRAQFKAGENNIILDQENLPVTNMGGSNVFRIENLEIVPIIE